MSRELAESLGEAAILATDESIAFWRDYVAGEAISEPDTVLVALIRANSSETFETLRITIEAFESAGVSLDELRVSLGLGSVRVSASIDEQAVEETQQAIAALRRAGRGVLLLTAPDAVHQSTDAFGIPESTLELMRPLKRQFDPRSVLNPGRVIPEL
jgi:hypothetical protein